MTAAVSFDCALGASGEGDVADVARAASCSSEPRRAGTRACGVANVRRHRPCVAAAVRGRCAQDACGEHDVADVTVAACRSSEPRRAGARARGVVNIRCHRAYMTAAVGGRCALGHVVAGVTHVTRCSSKPHRAGTRACCVAIVRRH